MNKHKINYQIKSTKSNNTYIDISVHDEGVFLKTLLSINSYMQELCLTTDPDISLARDWWRSGDKRFPYNKRLGKRNTPETMIAGLINNMIFGNQDNLSLEQLPFYEEIINSAVTVIEQIEDTKKFKLQTRPQMTGIVFGLGF
jgi:hypothetical protein